VAIAAHVGLPIFTTPADPPAVVPVPIPVGAVVSQVVISGMTSLPALVAPPEPIWLGGDISVRSIVETVDDVVDMPYVLPPLPGTRTFRLVERRRLLPRLGGRAVPVIGRLAPLGALDLGTLSVADAGASAADGRSAAPGSSAPRAAKKQTRWRAPLRAPTPAQVPSGASFAPATGGSSSGGGIPIFLALPFLAAMLDLARRVTLDRVALPSGHRSRVPEDPG